MNEELTVMLRGDSALAQLPPVLWNKDEITKRVDEMLSAYQGRKYTEDEIKNAKSDRAEVNRIEKQLAEAQKRVTDMYKQPVAQFTADIKALREKTKQVSETIDVQVKAVEDAKKEEKQADFKNFYAENIGEELKLLIPFEKLLDPKWLNASAAVGPARQELLVRIETCRAEIDTLRATCGDDFEAVERTYLLNLSVRDALAEYKRIQDTRAAQAAAEQARREEEAARAAAPVIVRPTEEQAEAIEAGQARAEANQHITTDGRLDFGGLQPAAEPSEPAKWYNFGAWLTDDDIAALRKLFADRGIRYGKAKI